MNNHEFKDTYLGPVPFDWEMIKLGDLFEPVNLKLKDFEERNEDIPILSMTRYQGLILQSRKFDKRVASRDTSNYKVVKHGHLVYGFPIDEGVIAILHRYPIGAVSPAYNVWKPTREIDLLFVDYLLKTSVLIQVYRTYTAHVVGRRRNLPQRDFVNIEIPLPPLPEQHAIAQVLTTVRQSIEATERVIAAAKELKRSMMKYLFNYGPVPVDLADQVALKETEIGDLPIKWEVNKLSDVVTFTRKPRNLNISAFERIPFIPMDAVPIDRRYPKYYLEKTPDEISSGIYAELNDIILAKITPSFENGKQAIIANIPTDFAYVTTEVFPISPNDKDQLNNLFLFYYLKNAEVRSDIAAKMEGTTGRQRVPKDVVRNTHIPIPNISQQIQIAEELDTVDTKVHCETYRKSALDGLFNSLLHQLMTGRVRAQY